MEFVRASYGNAEQICSIAYSIFKVLYGTIDTTENVLYGTIDTTENVLYGTIDTTEKGTIDATKKSCPSPVASSRYYMEQ